ncbi:MAG: YdcF family protein [Planctomycetes bacterium]|nr:YdcF family protein [Planctomycetota bacterium]
MNEASEPAQAPRRRRLLRALAATAALAALLYALSGPLLRALPGWLTQADDPREADALVVLAGDASGGRVDRALELFRAGYLPRGPFVLSGGELYPGMTWAELMRARAIAGGVPAERCVIQGRSRTTVEDAAFTAELLPAETKTVLLVTSDFHSARAAADFRRALGPEVEVLSAPSRSPWPEAWWRDPVAARALATECLKRLW